MDARIPTGRGRAALRRPTLGEALELLVGEGVVFGVGAAVVGVTGYPPLWWAVAGVMLVVGLRAAARLRGPEPRVRWDDGGSRYRTGSGSGSGYLGPGAGMAGYGGMAWMADGGGGGGGGDGGGGC
jgi:hypothetical protein